jgi:hypothetical protein
VGSGRQLDPCLAFPVSGICGMMTPCEPHTVQRVSHEQSSTVDVQATMRVSCRQAKLTAGVEATQPRKSRAVSCSQRECAGTSLISTRFITSTAQTPLSSTSTPYIPRDRSACTYCSLGRGLFSYARGRIRLFTQSDNIRRCRSPNPHEMHRWASRDPMHCLGISVDLSS